MKDEWWLADMKKSVLNRGTLDLLWRGFTRQDVLCIIDALGREALGNISKIYLGDNEAVHAGGIDLLIEAGLNPKAVLYYNNRKFPSPQFPGYKVRQIYRKPHRTPIYSWRLTRWNSEI